ncbi:MAG: hypothetical protein PHT12_00215 [Patescibacteria group bacterium]|nr:hypothetical protein [Patescibacteria group bacterium]
MSIIKYPYLPEGRTILYVPAGNKFMIVAKAFAQAHSLDKAMPNASVIVRAGAILGIGANGSNYHKEHGCRRVELKCRSGEGYDLCEGCSPKNHGEPTAIRDVLEQGLDPRGADLYLWGHWWCCQPCWEAMEEAGIAQVYLLVGSEVLFNRDVPGNIIGHQFDK